MRKIFNITILLLILTGCASNKLCNIVNLNKNQIAYIIVLHPLISYTQYIEDKEDINELYDKVNVEFMLVDNDYESIKDDYNWLDITMFSKNDELILGLTFDDDGYIYFSTSYDSSTFYRSIEIVELNLKF